MAKKTKTEAPVTPVAAPIPELQPEPVAQPIKKKKNKTATKKIAAVAEPEVVNAPEVVVVNEVEPVVIEPEPEPVVVETESDVIIEPPSDAEIPASTEKKTQRRRLVTKEKLLGMFEEFQAELLPILEASGNKKLIKQFKLIQVDSYKLLKIKTAQKKQKDATNSGFMRPVKPSPALETFLYKIGEKNSEPLTRAYLTTLICKYIKEKDLQNPKDRRIIFPDEELKTLFQIREDDTEPLTYYNIQKKIQPHVSRIEDVEVVVAS